MSATAGVATVVEHQSGPTQPHAGCEADLSRREDVDLVRLVREGSPAAFEVLVERYQARVFRLVGRFSRNVQEIEDIVQDVFLKVFRRLETFTFQASFYTWLYRIAVNTAMDCAGRSRRNPVRTVEDPAAWSDRCGGSSEMPESELMEEEVRAATREVLANLPEKFRTILVLREYEDLSYEEIAQVLEISIGTVESRLFRARGRFREKITRRYPGLLSAS